MPSRCYRCRRLTVEYATCRSCTSRLRKVWVATEYTGVAKELLYVLKFGRARAGATPIARHITSVLPDLPKDTLVTYVPTDTRRIRQRGYDQAELIAREIARLKGLGCRRLLTRTTHTRQVGATRAVRLKQLETAFLTTRHIPAHILLVDDVVTTGATLEAIAAVLRQAGARHVDAVVFAQKM